MPSITDLASKPWQKHLQHILNVAGNYLFPSFKFLSEMYSHRPFFGFYPVMYANTKI